MSPRLNPKEEKCSNNKINNFRLVEEQKHQIYYSRNKLIATIHEITSERNQLRQANEKLMREIDILRETAAEVESEKCACIALEEERESRYKLFFENVKLHQKIKELDGASNFIGDSDGDPVILKIALVKCSEKLSSTLRELKTMKDDYALTVPVYAYDTLQISYDEKVKECEKIKHDLKSFEHKYRRLVEECSTQKEEIVDLKDKLSELERAGTPRPQWQSCSDFIVGGGERWNKLKQGLSSRDILGVILKELGPSAETQQLEYFEGLGTDPVIPPYLQYEGRVRNLRLSRRELSVTINDIWEGKLKNGGDLSMQDYVTKYFVERYQQASVRAEWAYNVCSGCEQMLDDQQIKLFWGVLSGPLSEDIYYTHRHEWYTFRDNLRHQLNDQDVISFDDFEKVAKNTFRLKSEVDIKNIVDVARRQLKIKTITNGIDVDKLFFENEEGFDRIELAKELFRQRQIAHDKYVREILNELGGKKNPTKMISVDNLKRAFAVIDPHIDHIKMEKYVRWAFSDKKSDLKMIYPLPLKVLAAKLAAGNIERVGLRYSGKGRKRH